MHHMHITVNGNCAPCAYFWTCPKIYANLSPLPNGEVTAVDKSAFKVIGPDGHEWRIYADGRTEGFPEGSTVFNRIPLQALEMRAESCPTNRPAVEAGRPQETAPH